MKVRVEPSNEDFAPVCEPGLSVAATQFRREWIAAGRRSPLETAAASSGPTSSGRGVGRLGGILNRSLFTSRQLS